MDEISSQSVVTVTKMKHLVEVQYMEKINKVCRIRKLNNSQYVMLETGEIKDFNLSENRADNYNSLRQTFKKLRYLINNNFTGAKNELFITLTYRENMTDTKKLYIDFDKFMKRLRYRYKDKTSIEYLSVIEPQGRGAWHVHLLAKFIDLDEVFIPNKFDENNKPLDAPLYEMWGNGWVTIKRLSNVDNIGAYLTAYLADIELQDDNIHICITENRKVITKEIEGQEKAFIKGGRLHLYPTGINLYRTSRGIKKPKRLIMKYGDIKKIVGSAHPHYSKKIKVNDVENGFENTIIYKQYNLKRH